MRPIPQTSRILTLRLGIILVILALAISCVAASSAVGQKADDYDIDVNSSVPTSAQEVTIDRPGFGTYDIDSLGSYNAGNPITANVATPDSIDPSSLEFQLYAQSGRLIADKRPDDAGQTTFSGDTTDLSPGTYQLLAVSSSKAEALIPIVISGYGISVTHSTTVEQNSNLNVSGTITKTEANNPPASASVVLWNDEYDRRVSADITGDSYNANISLNGFSPGEYNLYVTANGNEQFQGTDEIKSIVEGDTVIVAGSVPHELAGNVSKFQYTAVAGDDGRLGARDLSDGINSWVQDGSVDGVEIGAEELSTLITYWANE